MLRLCRLCWGACTCSAATVCVAGSLQSCTAIENEVSLQLLLVPPRCHPVTRQFSQQAACLSASAHCCARTCSGGQMRPPLVAARSGRAAENRAPHPATRASQVGSFYVVEVTTICRCQKQFGTSISQIGNSDSLCQLSGHTFWSTPAALAGRSVRNQAARQGRPHAPPGLHRHHPTAACPAAAFMQQKGHPSAIAPPTTTCPPQAEWVPTTQRAIVYNQLQLRPNTQP
jgi:hypothetical protein